MKQPIRLTNKTAIALRKNAKQSKTAHYTAATIVSILMAAAAVYFGIQWLPAVPIMVVCCVLIDCAIVSHARSQYLMLISQAICTEAAAREIRSESREKKRKERAVSDYMEAKADVNQLAAVRAQEQQPFFEKGLCKKMDQAILEGETVVIPAAERNDDPEEMQDDLPRRRRQQKSLHLIKNNRAK